METSKPASHVTARFARARDEGHGKVHRWLGNQLREDVCRIPFPFAEPSLNISPDLLPDEIDELQHRGLPRSVKSDEAGELRKVQSKIDERLEVLGRNQLNLHVTSFPHVHMFLTC